MISQATQEQYVCLWLGCKVHGRTSCSRTWLERHVLAHAGTKPFRCIVEGCGMRFNSQVKIPLSSSFPFNCIRFQLSLERHVNGHFSTDSSQNGSAKKSVESGSVKLYKRNGKKIRFRRQPWSGASLLQFTISKKKKRTGLKALLCSPNVRLLRQWHNGGLAAPIAEHDPGSNHER